MFKTDSLSSEMSLKQKLVAAVAVVVVVVVLVLVVAFVWLSHI